MAGNIIPGRKLEQFCNFYTRYNFYVLSFLAIASTNAVIAGLIIFEAFKILEDKVEECRHVRNYYWKSLDGNLSNMDFFFRYI